MPELKALELVRDLVAEARAAGRRHLLETEGLRILEALGFDLPRRIFLRGPGDPALAALENFPGDRVVLTREGRLLANEVAIRLG